MTKYPKIDSIYKRNLKTHKLRMGEYSLPVYKYLENNDWIATEKVDGCNTRIGWNGSDMQFGGKTDNAQMPIPLVEKLHEIFTPKKLEKVFKTDKCDVTIFGEGYGGNIQNPAGKAYKPSGEFDFILFDIRIGKWWIRYADLMSLAEALEIKLVPVIKVNKLTELVEMIKYGFYSKVAENKTFYAEGIVCKPCFDILQRNGNRIITKIKYKDFQNIGME